MPSLTRGEAAERSALLRIRSYQVDLDLTTGGDTFRSTTRIVFDMTSGSDCTFLDVRPSADLCARFLRYGSFGSLRKIEALFEPKLTTARSGLVSPLKSPAVRAMGPTPAP